MSSAGKTGRGESRASCTFIVAGSTSGAVIEGARAAIACRRISSAERAGGAVVGCCGADETFGGAGRAERLVGVVGTIGAGAGG